MARKTRKEIWLVDTLHRHPGICFDEIERKFRMDFDGELLPKSSFRKLIDALAADMDIHLECERKGGYKYSLVPSNLDGEGELVKMQISALTLSNIMRDVMPESRCIEMDQVPTGDLRLYTICRAMKEGKRVRAVYESKDRGTYEFELCPFGVKMHLCKWYVVGRSLHPDHAENSLRTFALDRMVGVVLTKMRYTMPKRFSIQQYFEGCVGVLTMGVPETVILKVTGYQREAFKKLPLHESQQLEGTAADYDLYKYVLRPNNELMSAIISRGRFVEVVFPPALREKVAAEARATAELYSKPAEASLKNYGENCTFIVKSEK